jgi:hypothetical protein
VEENIRTTSRVAMRRKVWSRRRLNDAKSLLEELGGVLDIAVVTLQRRAGLLKKLG